MKTVIITALGCVAVWYVYQVVRTKLAYRRYLKLRSRMGV